ncbi:MAG TPA: IS110 family transposase [Vicinamibacterales bacterium]|nr:IS110 family transposase [Vicinamibacterales bacterium]
MDRLIERCAGIDVHQQSMVTTVRLPAAAGGRTVLTQTFGTMTADLLVLREWLQAHGVTHVAMESTGVYWRPLYYLLEDGFTVLLINMQHLSHVPGRKSDVRDSEWLAQLLECGLLRGSLVPPAAIRDLRDLTRYRKRQIEDRAQEVNRLHRVLQDAGLKLTTVMTDVLGVSGRAMVEALLHGTTDPAVLADLARGRLRRKLPALQQALRGQFRPQHAFLVTQILAKIDFLEEAIATLTEEIDRQLVPFEPTVTRLMTIPGLARRNAVTVFVETGGDMHHFPTAAHLCSWGSMCPGQQESAGKRQTGKTRDGNRYLRGALIEAGLATTRARGTALQARYYRIKRHRGHKKAVVAVGHQILEIAYYVMRDGVTYHELGADYFDRRDRERTTRRHIQQLEALGFKVTLETAA